MLCSAVITSAIYESTNFCLASSTSLSMIIYLQGIFSFSNEDNTSLTLESVRISYISLLSHVPVIIEELGSPFLSAVPEVRSP
jgi:hypothetical protein